MHENTSDPVDGYFLMTFFLARSLLVEYLWNICQENCFRIMPSFKYPSRLLGAPTVLNQMRFVRNFGFGKFYSISKKVCPRFSKKASVLVLLHKKRFYSKFFVEYFYNNIHNWEIIMFYQNRDHNFVPCYLICAWVNFMSIS